MLDIFLNVFEFVFINFGINDNYYVFWILYVVNYII